MTTLSLHPTPTYWTVAKEQLRAVGVTLRKEGILFVTLLAAIALVCMVVAVRQPGNVDIHTLATECNARMIVDSGDLLVSLFTMAQTVALVLPFGLAGFVVPFGVWRSDDPSRRSYHWAMPVPRGPHTIIKMVAGWIWLMLALVVYLMFAITLLVTLSHIIEGPNCLLALAWKQWVNPFSVTTLVYLLTSIAVIGSTHPWRWVGGLPIAYSIVLSLLIGLGQRDIAHVMTSVITGKYGLLQATYGGSAGASTSRWLAALAVWGVTSCAGIVVVAYQRSKTHVV